MFGIRFVKLLAIKLFEEGFLTTGQSAEMCGISRIDFISELNRMGIPVVKMDKEEIFSARDMKK